MYATRGSRRIAQRQTRTALARPEIPATPCSSEMLACRSVMTVMAAASSDGLSRLRAFLEKRDQTAGLDRGRPHPHSRHGKAVEGLPCDKTLTVFGRYPAVSVVR